MGETSQVLDSSARTRESSHDEGGRHESIPHPKRSHVQEEAEDMPSCVRICGAMLQSCESFLAFSNLTMAFLSDNKIHFIEPLASLPNLRLLDLSSNMVQFSAGHHSDLFFPRLSVLFLHNNLVRKLPDVQSFERAKLMRVLTMFGNPIEEGKVDPLECFNRFPSLLLVDNHVRADHFKKHDLHLAPVNSKKVLRTFLRRRFKSRLQRKVDHLFEIFRDPSRNIHDFEHFQDILSQVHRIYSNSTPYNIISRVAMGHSARTKFRMLYSHYLMPTITLQRWLLSAYLRRLVHSLLSGGIMDDQNIAKKLAKLPLSDDDLLLRSSNLTIFFHPKYADVIEQLAAKWGSMQSSSDSPILYLSNIFSFQRERRGGGNELFRAVLRMRRRARTLQEASHLARFPVRRFRLGRLTHVDTKTRTIFLQHFEHHHFDVLPSSRSQHISHRFLVVLKFKDEASRNHFINYVTYLNRTINSSSLSSIGSVHFLLGESVLRVHAACCVQATARRWLEYRSKKRSLKKAVLLLRSTRSIQHWWRWTCTRLRTEALACLAKALTDNGTSTTLYCISNNLKPKLLSHDRSVSFLPESKISFVFDENEDVQVLQPELASSDGRRVLPSWVGLQVRLIPWLPHEASLKSLLTQGTQIDIAEAESLKDEEDHALRFPNRRLFGSIPVLKFHFKSNNQARIRTTLLFIKTWSAQKRDPITLMKATDCQQHLMAALIQSVYRGHLSRARCHRLRNVRDVWKIDRVVSRRKFVELEKAVESQRVRKGQVSPPPPSLAPRIAREEMGLTGMTALDMTRGSLKGDMKRAKQSLVISSKLDKIVAGKLQEEKLIRSRPDMKFHPSSQSRIFSSQSRIFSSNLELFNLSKLEASVVVSLKEVELQQVRNRIKTSKQVHQNVMETASEYRSSYLEKCKHDRKVQRERAEVIKSINSQPPTIPAASKSRSRISRNLSLNLTNAIRAIGQLPTINTTESRGKGDRHSEGAGRGGYGARTG
mmetsp:Transcript_17327/g.57392  ORF Transcript_17327/g.57392 Transcript_17327/m.57392 type:complete len:993 (-) Transcript_17327:548-3526(-)